MKDKQGVLFSNLFQRPVTAVFDSLQSSSDDGSLLLKACDAALELTESLALLVRDGRQQLSLFSRFYDTTCYLPLVVFLTFDNKREQYLVCAVLRAGNAPAKQGVENRIKELKAGVAMDRASCTSFYANQFRVLLSAAAYALLRELRWRARETRFARTQAEGLRLCLLKLGVWVRSSTRRVVLSLPREAPYVSEWLQIARSLGAVPT